jgi:hypothetical protein
MVVTIESDIWCITRERRGPVSTRQVVIEDRPHPSRIRHKIECALVIPMVIQTILLSPFGPDQIDAAPNVSR